MDKTNILVTKIIYIFFFWKLKNYLFIIKYILIYIFNYFNKTEKFYINISLIRLK